MAGQRVVRGVLACIVVCCGIASTAAAADRGIDTSKLKKGDKLEIQRFGKWQPARFVEATNSQLIRVEISDFRGPIGVLIDDVRLPAKKVVPRAADDPFATPEEKAQIGEMRTWSAAGGKSTVEAQLLRLEGDSVVLRRSDDKEVTVPLEKLGEADRKYVADFRAGKVPLKSAASDIENEASSESDEPSIPITNVDLGAAEQVQVSSEAVWKYIPAAAPVTDFPRTASIKLRPSPDIFEHVDQVFLIRSPSKAVVSMRHTPPGKPASNRLQVVNLTKRQLEKDITLDGTVSALAMSADGSLLAARTEGIGLGAKSELRLFRIEGDKTKMISRWLSSESKADLDWAAFIDNKHLMTINQSGQLTLWDVTDVRPIYTLQTAVRLIPALQAGKLAVLTDSHMAILNAADGAVEGAIPLDAKDGFMAIMAFSEDGSKLAARQNGRVRVWDLQRKELWREISATGQTGHPSVGWSGELLGIDGVMLLDPERRLPVARNSNPITIEAIMAGTAWSIQRAPNLSGYELVSGPILPKAFKNPLASKSAEELLAIKPGMEVAVEINVGSDETRKLVVSRLESEGLKVVPQSNVRLVGTLGMGQAKTENYRQIMGPRQTTAVTVTEQILTLQWMVGGDVVWKDERRFGAPFHIRMQAGESIQQAVDRTTQANPAALASIWVPAYVAVAPKD